MIKPFRARLKASKESHHLSQHRGTMESLDFGNEVRVNMLRVRKAILGTGSGSEYVLFERRSFAVGTGSVQADVVNL